MPQNTKLQLTDTQIPTDSLLVDVDMFLQPMDEKGINHYNTHWKSVLKSFNQVVQEIKQLGLSKDLRIVNLDDHADIYSLPSQDCILLSAFNSYTQNKNLGFAWFIGVSTFEDMNNHRLSQIIAFLFSRYAPGRSMRIVNDELLQVATLSFTEGSEVMPMTKEKNRSIQMLSVQSVSTEILS